MAAARADSGGRRANRVRLAIDALTPLTRQAIEGAVSLAAEGGWALDCVFVEQLELIRAAALPSTRVLGMTGASPRSLDPEDLERALRQQAAQAQRLIGQAALGANLEWSFEVARGAILEEALRRAEPRDLLVVGVAGCELDLPQAPRPSSREPQRTLLALVESLPEDLATIRAALRALPGGSLAIWAAGEAARSAAELELQVAALEHELGRPLRRLPAAAQAQVLATALEQALAELRPRLLALQRETLAALAADLAWSLRRRPAMLVAVPRGEAGR